MATRTELIEDNWIEFLHYVNRFNEFIVKGDFRFGTSEKDPTEIVFWHWFRTAKLGTAATVGGDSSGGHVYDQAKTDEGWKPDQKGGVVTAEPDSVARAREAGEKLPTDNGGDMKQ